ncbi:MAG: Flp pilus assembly complex ATPase component TadA [Victivallales bacterium]|nr:Flp pilus assembly complex ATPase component TadA [Victivallales bacterium]
MPTIDIDADVSVIWHLLLDNGIATEEQLEDVYDDTQRLNRSFTQLLFNYNIISQEDLLKLIADSLGTTVFTFKDQEIDPSVYDKLPADTARFYGIIPVAYDQDTNELTLVAKEPLQTALTDELPFILGFQTRILVGWPAEVDQQMDTIYPEKQSSVDDVIGELAKMHEGGDLDDASEEDLTKAANEAPIVRFVNLILQQAIKDKASDIHFEPFSDEFRIRYRIDGSLFEMAPPPQHLAVPVISRIKVISGLNIAERRHPQDGRIELRINRKPVDLRVSTLPTRYGESVVLRILDRTVVDLNLDNLGMSEYIVTNIRRLVTRPNGIVVVTGPTGSGKTTTLYSALKEINTVEDKLLTAEDPVEYDIEGIMQVPIKESVGMTFASALRAFLRQDPDRIMVGEIRDGETAAMAVQASLTGHFVLSTLHTNDAAGAVTRLIDMGVEPFLISSTLVGVLAQRLIRRVCTKCKEAYEPTDLELEQLGMTREELAGRPFYKGRGCDRCNNSGYKGRVGIFELLLVSPAIQQLVNKRETTQNIKLQAEKEGMTSLRRDGISHILEGITTVREVLQYTF